MSEAQKNARVQQWVARQDVDDLSLIPPLAEEFTLYGGSSTVERARKWALEHRYLLADGIPRCAHGLYLFASCPVPNSCRTNCGQLDHARIWVPADLFGARPFLLAHPYADKVDEETLAYAGAHGLRVDSYRGAFGDDWYGSENTIPIRLAIPPDFPVWPIEAKAAVLLGTHVVAWPEDEE